MLILRVLMLSGVCAVGEAPSLENAMPVRVVGPWSISVGPGTIVVNDEEVSLPEGITLEIEPSGIIPVRDEAYASVPVFNEKAGGWCKGAKLRKLITEECTATDALVAKSLRIKPSEGDVAAYTLGTDYVMDGFWGTFGRLAGSTIGAQQEVFVDYDYSPCRLDSVVVDKAGHVRLLKGTPDLGVVLPPEPAAGERAIVNIWVASRLGKLSEENLFPIEFREPAEPAVGPSAAERFLPKTLGKLRAGEPVTIVAWGDSVTNGGGVGARTEQWYQQQFEVLLKARFPQAPITMLTAAWPGGSSRTYMQAPPGGERDFVRDVLEPKPDLVTIEFVNDAYLDEEGTMAHYAKILDHLQGVGAEVVLITPHLVRPDWLRVNTLKVDADPRPYVKGLRRFAGENGLALADASTEWCGLWRKGIPYVTLLANSINHPDVRGHAIFAQVLMGLFPEK